MEGDLLRVRKVKFFLMVLTLSFLVSCKHYDLNKSSNKSTLATELNGLPRIEAVEVVLTKLIKESSFPRVDLKYSDLKIEASNEEIPKAVEEIFNSLSQSVFGDQRPLKLKACIGFECTSLGGAVADIDHMTIYIHVPTFSERNDSTSFILAHEFSHYLYELAVSRYASSPNGQLSLIDEQWQEGLDIEQQLLRGGQAHAEVDLFALTLLKRNKISVKGAIPVLQNAKELMEIELRKLQTELQRMTALPNPEEIRLNAVLDALNSISRQ